MTGFWEEAGLERAPKRLEAEKPQSYLYNEERAGEGDSFPVVDPS